MYICIDIFVCYVALGLPDGAGVGLQGTYAQTYNNIICYRLINMLHYYTLL